MVLPLLASVSVCSVLFPLWVFGGVFSLLIDLFNIENNSARQRNAWFVLKQKHSGYLYSSIPRCLQQQTGQNPMLLLSSHATDAGIATPYKLQMGSSAHN